MKKKKKMKEKKELKESRKKMEIFIVGCYWINRARVSREKQIYVLEAVICIMEILLFCLSKLQLYNHRDNQLFSNTDTQLNN